MNTKNYLNFHHIFSSSALCTTKQQRKDKLVVPNNNACSSISLYIESSSIRFYSLSVKLWKRYSLNVELLQTLPHWVGSFLLVQLKNCLDGFYDSTPEVAAYLSFLQCCLNFRFLSLHGLLGFLQLVDALSSLTNLFRQVWDLLYRKQNVKQITLLGDYRIHFSM